MQMGSGDFRGAIRVDRRRARDAEEARDMLGSAMLCLQLRTRAQQRVSHGRRTRPRCAQSPLRANANCRARTRTAVHAREPPRAHANRRAVRD